MASTIKSASPRHKPAGDVFARPNAILDTDKHDSPESDSSTWAEEEVNKWAVSMTGKRNERDKRVAKVKTLRHDAVRPVLRKNKAGKVDGYSTTASIIVKDWNKRGEMFYAVIPTVFRDDPKKEPTVHSAKEALAQYKKTGDSWGGMYSYDDARRLSQAVHEKHSRKFNRDWNAYRATAPIEDLAQEFHDDPHLNFIRKAIDAIYGYVRPEEGWDTEAVRVGNAYRIGPGLLEERYVRDSNGFRKLVRNTANDKIDTDHETGVYAAKNRIYDVLAARRNDGSGVSLFDPEVIPETVGRDLVVLGSLGYHYGQSTPLTIDLGNNTTNAIAAALADAKYTRDGGRDVTGRRMRDFEYLTKKPGKELSDFTEDAEMKKHINLLSLPGKGSYTDSPAYPHRNVRQAAKGGESEPSGEMTESADSVNSESAADTPVMSGPRIVINPSTFRNRKDALCVAFNERFRIAMEQYGFEPQSEPTPKQRRFFADTAYADDEVQLRRTILARILTLDTSVKDPTDEQLAEAGEFLQAFKEREQPSNDWEAAAVDRIAELVAAVKPAGRPPAAPRTEGSTQADIGGGLSSDQIYKSRRVDDSSQMSGQTSGSTLSGSVNWLQATPISGGTLGGTSETNGGNSGMHGMVSVDVDRLNTEAWKQRNGYGGMTDNEMRLAQDRDGTGPKGAIGPGTAMGSTGVYQKEEPVYKSVYDYHKEHGASTAVRQPADNNPTVSRASASGSPTTSNGIGSSPVSTANGSSNSTASASTQVPDLVVNADLGGGETEWEKRKRESTEKWQERQGQIDQRRAEAEARSNAPKQYSNPDSDTTKAFLERQELTALRKGIGQGDQQSIQTALQFQADPQVQADPQAQANGVADPWIAQRKRDLAQWATNWADGTPIPAGG